MACGGSSSARIVWINRSRTKMFTESVAARIAWPSRPPLACPDPVASPLRVHTQTRGRAARSRPGAPRGSKWRRPHRAGLGTHDARTRTPNDRPVRCRRARRNYPTPPPAPRALGGGSGGLPAACGASNGRHGRPHGLSAGGRRRRRVGFQTCGSKRSKAGLVVRGADARMASRSGGGSGSGAQRGTLGRLGTRGGTSCRKASRTSASGRRGRPRPW